MKVQSAIIYAFSGYIGGLLGELWRLRQGGRPADLGFAGAVIILGLFTVLYATIIYGYGAFSRYVRWVFTDRSEWVSSYAAAAVVGLPFWFILLPLHTWLRDDLKFPDSFWLVEVLVLCAASYEVIRFSSKLLNEA